MSRALLFETMVFSPSGQPLRQLRCSTWEQAVAQHEQAPERSL